MRTLEGSRVPTKLGPFISFYGAKWRAAPLYPVPRYSHIIEPFAGSAGYAIRYAHLDVTLYDRADFICGIWDYLIHTKESELSKLPVVVNHVDELSVCQEAKWLIGLWLNIASSSPSLQSSTFNRIRISAGWTSCWSQKCLNRIVRQVKYIRHWKINKGSYYFVPNQEVTWFIDPPYVKGGKLYKHQITNYPVLGTWCKKRLGQVIVCEEQGAEWLPFRPVSPFTMIQSSSLGVNTSRFSEEVMWYRES